MMPNQIALYARVSSGHQAEAGTIQSQIAALRERIAQDQLKLSDELTFIDDGYSGATLIRPALEQLRDVIALQGVDRLYVHSPDRLARKYAYQVLLLEEFQRAGVEVIFLNRAVSQDPEEDLLLQVQGMIAEYERAKLSERSRRGKRYAAHHGRVSVLSRAPYGYRYLAKHEGDGQAHYAIVPHEAQIMRQIFHWIGHERLTIGEVRRRLHQAAHPSPTGKPRWDRSTIWTLLKNPAYKGQAAFGKTKTTPMNPRLRPHRGAPAVPKRPVSTVNTPESAWIYLPVPAIVSEELFAAVQEQLQENRRRARQLRAGASYLLQGLTVCAQCGYTYYGCASSAISAQGKRYLYSYYRCVGADAKRFGKEKVCDNTALRTADLEQMVWSQVALVLQDTQRLEQEYRRRLQTLPQKQEDGELVQTQIATSKRALSRLIDAYAEGLLEKQEFEPRLARLRQRIETLTCEAHRLTDQLETQAQLRLAITSLEQFAVKVRDSLDTADWHLKRELIRALVQRIEISHEEINVVFRIPPVPFDSSPYGGFLQHCWHCKNSLFAEEVIDGLRFAQLLLNGFERRQVWF
jgi:site-specific DNA recombinase